MKYVLLFVDTPEFAAEFDAMSPETRGRAVQKVYDWLDTNADKLRGGNKLRAPETAPPYGWTVRDHAGRLAAVLVRMTGDFATAEDLVQDAVLAAPEHWSVDGIPHRPDAWLFSVARRRGLDQLRRAGNYQAKLAQLRTPRDADRRALDLTDNPAERALLRRRITWP